MEGNIGTVGISQYAQDSLGDIVYVQLPEEGDEYDMEDECGALESVKAASEIFCPLSGKVTAKNGNVEDTPGLINKSPYDDGWLFKLELKNPEELDQMMDEDTYQSFLKAQQEE
jgi:glycine cleavage system H protein